MSQQALNSIELYRGNDPVKIEMLLRIQATRVVNELKEFFGVSDNHSLAVKLSRY